jgi:hypothetical protein
MMTDLLSTERKIKSPVYEGFEQGPIRPPSEAASLLIRVTRNCPWNLCTFCPIYKQTRFSIRPKEHVIRDIDTVHKYVRMIGEQAEIKGKLTQADVRELFRYVDCKEENAFYAALHWFAEGMTSIFIQDANSLIIKPDALAEILVYLRHCFPWVERITSYARSHTVSRIKDEDLKTFREAGLNRIHIGMESGSDKVLTQVRKGTTKAMHIAAGQKVIRAEIELSEYVMPGLGGREYSEVHAMETADAINQINPHYIRLRTLAIPSRAPLFETYRTGGFDKCSELMTVREILLFIQNLNGITSVLKSDHILNLFQDVEGVFPHDKQRMTDILHTFLDMGIYNQLIYQVGRRLGILKNLEDMNSAHRYKKLEGFCRENHITAENADTAIDELMRRFV